MLEVESGFNDAIAILLVVALADLVAGQSVSWLTFTLVPIAKLVGGAAIGIVVGFAAAYFLDRVYLPEGLFTILVAAFGFTSFGLGETIGASGFLAVYVCGAVIAGRSPRAADIATTGIDSVAWLAQTGLFLMLGLFITPSHLAVIALPAVATALWLMLISRPLTVFGLLRPFEFDRAQTVFVAWTGLRGATPIYLGLLPLMFGVPNANLYLSVAASVTLVSLVVQAWSAPLLARQLGLGAQADPDTSGREILLRFVSMALVIAMGVWFARSLSEPPLVLAEPRSTPGLAAWAADAQVSGSQDAVGRFPRDFPVQPATVRQDLFAVVVARAAAVHNDAILRDRSTLLAFAAKEAAAAPLSLSEQADRDRIARAYAVNYDELEEALRRVDALPPSLAIAQAALATGWGSAAELLGRNDVFGRAGGAAAYTNLIDATSAYALLINTHRDFAELRAEREKLRAAGEPVTGAALAPFVGPYAASGADYAASVTAVIRSRALASFDGAFAR